MNHENEFLSFLIISQVWLAQGEIFWGFVWILVTILALVIK